MLQCLPVQVSHENHSVTLFSPSRWSGSCSHFSSFFESLFRIKQLTVSWGHGHNTHLCQCGPSITEFGLLIVNSILKAASRFFPEVMEMSSQLGGTAVAGCQMRPTFPHTSSSGDSPTGHLDNWASSFWLTQRWHTQWRQPSPLSSWGISSRLSHKRFAFILSFRPHLRFIKYLLFLGRACLFSGVCFQHWFGPVRRLNSAVSDTPVFGLAAGDGGLAGSGGSECAGSVWLSSRRWANWAREPYTLRPFTLAAAHRIEYGLFGGQWQCQECWARVPPWEKKKGISLSVTLSHPPPTRPFPCIWRL